MAFSGTQITRHGLHGGARGLYGTFSGKVAGAAAQVWLDFPEIVAVRDRSTWVPFTNSTGQTLNIGDVLCWNLDPDGRTVAAIPSAANLYLPAGIVIVRAVADGLFGYLAVGGTPVNARVLGAAGLIAGYPLTPVAGQTYLTKAGLTPEGGAYYPFISCVDHTDVSIVEKRVLVRTHQ